MDGIIKLVLICILIRFYGIKVNYMILFIIIFYIENIILILKIYWKELFI